MDGLFRFPSAARRDPEVERWLIDRIGALGALAVEWFGVLRACGDDVREVMHDGRPTVCVSDAAFAYVDVYTKHVNVGFFRGAELSDPDGLLEGSGRFMRHVKLRVGGEPDAEALRALIDRSRDDMRRRLESV